MNSYSSLPKARFITIIDKNVGKIRALEKPKNSIENRRKNRKLESELNLNFDLPRLQYNNKK